MSYPECTFTDPDIRRLELALARTVARCLGALPGPGPFAPIPSDCHRDISSYLERLLGVQWVAAGLSPYRWFDGLSVASYEVQAPDGLVVTGLMWCAENREQWLDHFSADLRLTAGHNDLLDYTLRLGRRGEDARARSSKYLLREWALLDHVEWAHTFRSRPPAGQHH